MTVQLACLARDASVICSVSLLKLPEYNVSNYNYTTTEAGMCIFSADAELISMERENTRSVNVWTNDGEEEMLGHLLLH